MEVTLYTLFKRQNSTLRPSGAAGENALTMEGEIKGTNNIMSPVFTFNLSGTVAPLYNYAYVPAFSRYYFINSWSWVNGLWVAVFTIDSLATFKDRIEVTPFYCLRSSARYDGSIVDTHYVSLGPKNKQQTLYDNPFSSTWNGGSYIVGVVNNAIDSVGATSYYVFSQTYMRSFMNRLYGDLSWAQDMVTELGQATARGIINPLQYITSIMWFPFQIVAESVVQSIPIGYWNMPVVAAGLLAGTHATGTLDMTVPKHPQTAERGNWVNKSPNTSYSIEFWPFGVIALDGDKIVTTTTLNLSWVVDYITGVGTLRITDTTDALIATAQAEVGVPIQLAQMSLNWGNLTSGLLAGAITALPGVVSALTDKQNTSVESGTQKMTFGQALRAAIDPTYGLGLGEGQSLPEELGVEGSDKIYQSISQAATDFVSGTVSGLAEVNINGSNGSIASYSLGVRLNMFYYLIAPEDLDHYGRPCCEVIAPQTYGPGFYLFSSADIEILGSLTEHNLVNSYLNGGFFYE